MSTTNDPRSCRHCGEPLPPQSGRGRPRVVHAGECSRKYNNKRRLNWRIEKFRAAHRADRSDLCPWAASQYNADEYDPEGYSTSRGAYDDVHGELLIEAMNAWEEAEKIRRLLFRAEYDARAAERRRWLDEQRTASTDEEWKARIAAAVAARRSRQG